MSGKATFYEPGRGSYKQLREDPHPSQVAEEVQRLPKKILNSLMVELQLRRNVPSEQKERAAKIEHCVNFFSEVAKSAKNLPPLISAQDVIATLEETALLCEQAANEAMIRDIFKNGKMDAQSEALIVQEIYQFDKLNGRIPVRTNPAALSLNELRQVAQNALIEVPRSRGGRPRMGDTDRALIPLFIDTVLGIDPDAQAYFEDNPDLCFRVLDAVFGTEHSDLEDVYREVLAHHYKWFPKDHPKISEGLKAGPE